MRFPYKFPIPTKIHSAIFNRIAWEIIDVRSSLKAWIFRFCSMRPDGYPLLKKWCIFYMRIGLTDIEQISSKWEKYIAPCDGNGRPNSPNYSTLVCLLALVRFWHDSASTRQWEWNSQKHVYHCIRKTRVLTVEHCNTNQNRVPQPSSELYYSWTNRPC
jgi:hypothetical protein